MPAGSRSGRAENQLCKNQRRAHAVAQGLFIQAFELFVSIVTPRAAKPISKQSMAYAIRGGEMFDKSWREIREEDDGQDLFNEVIGGILMMTLIMFIFVCLGAAFGPEVINTMAMVP